MFAPWIPEALDQIAALADLPNPPTIRAIDVARRQLSTSRAGKLYPKIIAIDGGVDVSWGETGFFCGRSGHLIDFSPFQERRLPVESTTATTISPPNVGASPGRAIASSS